MRFEFSGLPRNKYLSTFSGWAISVIGPPNVGSDCVRLTAASTLKTDKECNILSWLYRIAGQAQYADQSRIPRIISALRPEEIRTRQSGGKPMTRTFAITRTVRNGSKAFLIDTFPRACHRCKTDQKGRILLYEQDLQGASEAEKLLIKTRDANETEITVLISMS